MLIIKGTLSKNTKPAQTNIITFDKYIFTPVTKKNADY